MTGKILLMHREITNCPKGLVVDHINHNTLDNRRDNLRVCTQSENIKNSRVRNTNKTGLTGVHYDKSRNRWMSYVTVNKKRKNLGRFKTLLDACCARKSAENKYYGEFAYNGS